MLAVPGHDVGISRARKQQLDFRRVELVIGIHQEDPGEARGAKARPQRRPVAAIDRVTDDAQIRMRRLEPFQHRRGAVLAAVIDDDDLESSRKGLQRARHSPHRLLQIALLVVGGHHRADLHRGRNRRHGAKPTRMNTVATSSRLGKELPDGWSGSVSTVRTKTSRPTGEPSRTTRRSSRTTGGLSSMVHSTPS